MRGDFVDSGVESAIQLLNETMCIAKSGETEWAVEVCRNGGGTLYTETDSVLSKTFEFTCR